MEDDLFDNKGDFEEGGEIMRKIKEKDKEFDDSDNFDEDSSGFKGKKGSLEFEHEKVSRDELLSDSKKFFLSQKKELGEMAKKGEKVVKIGFEDISEFSPKLAENLIQKPEETMEILEQAIVESELVSGSVRVRLKSLIDTQKQDIRNIRAKHLNKLIFIEGLIRQSSDVRPRVVNAKFECPSCGTILSILQLEQKFKEPTRCSCGRRGGFRELSKDMVDAQRIVVEESHDDLEGGEQPKRLQVFLKEDLVEPKMEEKTTPGSRVRIIGILKEVPKFTATGALSVQYDLAIEANNIIPLEESFENMEISEQDEIEIKELAADPHIYEKITNSIAPSVWGYPEIKQVLALQLFGGVQKTRSEGVTKTRGDIHVLLVGDPGVAKSVMLKFIAGIAPKGRYVSGKSASGAGLTASVIKDDFMRGWSLEAGAMVLSNKGLICIDEIEKMDEEDRSTMHEAMEQQTVTISKANIQASLRSQTSVLAAANPKFGRFDPMEPVPKQVNLSPALISRFDAIFILRDIPNKDKDESIAMHVLREHKQEAIHVELIEKKLLKKYISYCRQKSHPKLSDEAIKEMKDFYVQLRNQPTIGESAAKPIPISARQLEGLVRLAEATAKIRLSKTVTKEDAQRAISLMKYYLMGVGYDPETKTYDIDRISGIPASKRGKIMLVKEVLEKLENKLGKLIPIEEIEKEIGSQLKKDELEEAILRLRKEGDLFEPKKGYVQKM